MNRTQVSGEAQVTQWAETFWVYGISCFHKGALPWYHRKQQGLLFSLLEPVGEVETAFTCVIVFRVVFEVTFERLKLFKKGSPPCHTHGQPALLSTRRKQVL